jgi:hypothetical protein
MLFEWGGGGIWEGHVLRETTSLCRLGDWCVCLLLQDLVQSCLRGCVCLCVYSLLQGVCYRA